MPNVPLYLEPISGSGIIRICHYRLRLSHLLEMVKSEIYRPEKILNKLLLLLFCHFFRLTVTF